MAEQIKDGTGSDNYLTVLGDGSIKTSSTSDPTEGANPAWKFEYIISGTGTGVTGSSVGSIIQFIGAGSFTQVLTWGNDLVTDIGSYS
jgi:hypothetical protein